MNEYYRNNLVDQVNEKNARKMADIENKKLDDKEYRNRLKDMTEDELRREREIKNYKNQLFKDEIDE